MAREYKCSRCGKLGCKLWREYQTFAVRLLCSSCACKDQGKNESQINDEGMILSKYAKYGGRSNQIGWFVPAIPTEDGESFWGNNASVPQERMDWWKNLPLIA